MITESQQRTIRRECDVIIAMCQAALEHCVRLNAKCLQEDNKTVEQIADHIRIGMMAAGILRDINDNRKVSECQQDK
jgi:hypothetical protein